jgi:hypothetical protein
MVIVRECDMAAGGDHVGLVDAEGQDSAERHARQGGGEDDQQDRGYGGGGVWPGEGRGGDGGGHELLSIGWSRMR